MVSRKKERNTEKNGKRRKNGLEENSGKHRKAVRKWNLQKYKLHFGPPLNRWYALRN